MLIIESGGLGLSMGRTSDRWKTGASVTPGVWQHVVSVYDNGAMRFYLNGTEYTLVQMKGIIHQLLNLQLGVIITVYTIFIKDS